MSKFKVSHKERDKLWRAFNKKCALCGKPLNRDALTVDHKTPLCKGGTHDATNWQPTHKSCNNMKGDMTMPEWEWLRFTGKV